ncbi:amidohydrolase family protein [Yersinia mollaretii]|uniref:Amidohydrolase-related domain-containing protein n=1 Tax=Yersinia mollaretii (strain ATCC 43969 / DSM 18520 / CIP 103324 / CNY 7263 / WAIP 204) TaxID=349967 RepID=A0ABM9YCX2_YERMW|nr:amidohydrolase family protein [Yersinia mollaretii]EEQ11778.1 hypothetical protein ymoll0001_35400 [Yersinia mollaretii ATCC 43969]MDN0111417.1 amidohydrolase family protein [Yersinia mollaretii]PJE86154.1 amidohydrolase [Yersinia mollaretii]QKJ01954.1 amidohydrolase [Yersinia mollaretii ATCC 43969]CQD44279.1 Predicted metal-dependent hydrolase of the TIM-barrel fold [Yersinia mollaretii]
MKNKIIAVEEAFITSDIVTEWDNYLSRDNVEPGFRMMGKTYLKATPSTKEVQDRLLNMGTERIADMNSAGIDMQILSLCSPGVQIFEPTLGTMLAHHANDILSDAIKAFPTRFAGLAAIAPQDPNAAVIELARCKRLGLKGVIINSHTMGEYLDAEKYLPILESCESLGLPIYLHPREPSPSMIAPYLDYGLYFAGWGFAAETGLHALRLIMSGIFDKLPKLKIILGHLGEGLPFWLQRIDNRYKLQVSIGAVRKMRKLPSEYFRLHFVITTSGMYSDAALQLCLTELGADSILFAADYPHESAMEAVVFMDSTPISNEDRDKIYWKNAMRVFDL